MGRAAGASRENRRRTPHPGVLAMAVAAAIALWILFVASSLNADEMYVGAGCVALTLLFSVHIGRSMQLEAVLRPADLAQAWRLPGYILIDISVITCVLIKDLLHIESAGNLFRACAFDSSTRDPIRVARTILAVAYTTTAPNFLVVGIDQAHSCMLFHQISASPVPIMAKRLGARA